jgi:competence protein ComEC
MANALMTGERSGISQATNDLYRDAGIFHILSISGLHMAIMGGAVFLALRFMLAAFPFIALRYPIKKWAAVAAAIATFGYLLISGGAHPTVRSFIMILIAFIAIVLDRPAIALRNVALAALIILVVLPESLFNAGFQLSFAAVVALIATYEAYEARKRRLRTLGYTALKPTGAMFGALRGIALFMAGTIATTVIAGLATAPFAAFHFHTSQQYSVLTNMLAIPVSNLIVMPAALAAFVAMPLSLERMPLAVMGWGIDFMTWAAGLVTAMPGAVTAVPAFPEYALQAMVFGGLWLCIWRMNWRWLGLAVVFAGLYLTTTGSYPDALIGRDGRIVAVRGSDGRLAAIKADRASYEFGRWLENDGDPRKPAEAWSKAPFRCDLEGCTARLAQHLIAIPRSPAALTDDCKHAAVLVMSFPKPPGCQTDAVVLDYSVLNRHGTHTVYLDLSGNLRLENVEQFRGQRPWSVATLEAARQQEFEQLRAARRTRQFRSETRDVEAAAASPQYQRPEIDDGHPLYWFQ